MKALKRFIAIFMCVVLTLTAAPLQGFVGLDLLSIFTVKAMEATDVDVTDRGTCGDNLTWTIYDNGELVISGTGYMDIEWVSPSDAPWYSYSNDIKTVNIGNGVTFIGCYAFYGCRNLTSVTIGNAVIEIGQNAFAFCDSLKSVTIPNSVISISYNAFYGCDSLTSITIPYSVISISTEQFCNCDNLTNITVDDNNQYYSSENGILFNKDKSALLCYPGGKTAKEYTIPDYVTDIGEQAFSGNAYIETLNIPESVTTIGDQAFYGCDSLTSITIPDSITTIGNYAFCYCNSLTDVYYNGTQSQWDEISIASNNDPLTSATIHFLNDEESTTEEYTTEEWITEESTTEDVTQEYIDEESTFVIDATTTTVPVTEQPSIEDESDLDHTTTTHAPETTTREPETTETATVDPDGFITMSVGETKSVSVTSGNLTYICFVPNETAFYKFCSSGDSDTVGYLYDLDMNQLEYDDDDGSGNNFKITRELHAGETYYIGVRFYNSSASGLITVTLTKSDACGTCGDNLTWELDTETGVLEISGTGEMGGWNSSDEKPWEDYLSAVKKVVVGDGVTTVGFAAFWGCENLKNVIIPASVRFIPENAFHYCESLKSITIDENNIDYLVDGNGVLFNKDHTTLVRYPEGKDDTYYVIPDEVTVILSDAFFDCDSLTSVTIPDSVTTIGYGAFEGCDSLTSITVDENNNYYSSDEYSVLFNKDKTELILYPIGNERTSYTIPDSVVTIGYGVFENCDHLTSVTIPDSVTSIGDRAFFGCRSLISVTIPGSVIIIGCAAFWCCYSLTSVTIGNNVTTIDFEAFEGCHRLTDIYYTGTEKQWNRIRVLEENEPLTSATIHFNYRIPGSELDSGTCGNSLTWAFYGDGTLVISGEGDMYNYSMQTDFMPDTPWREYSTMIRIVVLENGVTSAGILAFYGCESLADVVWADTITCIGEYSFSGCALTELSLPEHTEEIAAFSFSINENLEYIYIPKSTNSIAGSAFYGCHSLKNIIVDSRNNHYSNDSKGVLFSKNQTDLIKYPEGRTEKNYVIPLSVEIICDSAFQGAGFENILIPGSVKVISVQAFDNCKNLDNLIIPDSVKEIGAFAFSYCYSITEIAIPANVTEIGGYAFEYCTSLSNATFEEGCTQISEGIFNGCNSLREITIPKTVTTVGDSAFESCDILTDVYYSGTQSKWNDIDIGDHNDDLLSADIHFSSSNVVASGACGTNAEWSLYNTGKLVVSGVGAMYNYSESTRPEWYTYADSITSVSVNDGITAIGKYAFGNLPNLKNVYIADSVIRIESDAFTRCTALESVVLPEALEHIGVMAFWHCDSLTEFYIPATVSYIGAGAFADCDLLERITVASGNEYYSSDVTGVLFDKEKTILMQYPIGNKKRYYNIPDTVVIIDERAFACNEYLTELGIPVSVTTIGYASLYACNGLTRINYSGTQSQFENISVGEANTALSSVPITYETANKGIITIRINCIGEAGAQLPPYMEAEFSGNAYVNSSVIAQAVSQYLYGLGYPESSFIIDGNSVFLIEADGSKSELTDEIYGTAPNSYDFEITVYVLAAVVASGTCGENVDWWITDTGKLVISGTGAMYDYLSWNSSSDSYDFTPRPWDEYIASITSVEVCSGITYIGSGAFTELYNIKTVSLPETVLEIGSGAFAACTSLTGFTVDEDNPIFMADEEGVLYGREDMNALPEEYRNEEYEYALVLFNYPIGNGVCEYTVAENVYAVGDYAFAFCPTLEKITFPQTYLSLGEAVLSHCPALRTVTLNPLKLIDIDDNNYDWIEQCLELIYIIEADCGVNVKSKLVLNAKDPDLKATLTISGTGEMYDYSYDDQPWYEFREIITEVIIEDGVTGIGNYAFVFCDELQSVTIGNSVTTIGEGAFGACYSLQSITIPDSVVAIEMIAFRGCGSLESITLGNGLKTIGMYAFSDCDSLQSITIPDSVTTVDIAAFEDCYNLESVTIGNNVTEISGKMFDNCDNLTSIVIPDSVKKIGTGAFYSCNSLESVTFGTNSQLTEIGYQSFYNCNALENIVIPDSVIIIRMSAFEDCYDLASVTFGENSKLTEIEDCVFRECSDLISVEIPDSVTRIGENVFGADFSKLKSVTFGEKSKLTTIGDEAFSYCESLEGITIPASVTEIGEGAFIGCQSLTAINVDEANEEYCSVDGVLYSKDKTVLLCYPAGKADTEFTIPDTVKKIGEYAFTYCYNLETLIIPDSVTTIGSYAFYGSEFTIVSSFGGLTEIGDYAFAYCDFTTFDIPDGIETIGNYAFYKCYNLQSVTIPDSVTVIGSCAFAYCTNLTSVTIPDSVVAIGKGAFTYCISLTKAEIGSGLKRIPQNMFENCYNLTDIEISEGVTDIGDYAFYDCDALKTVNIPASVTTIGTEAFDSCESIEGFEVSADNGSFCSENGVLFNKDKTVLICYPAGKTARSYTVPSTVTEILPYAFSGAANLRQITIPETVTTIGGYAFSYSGLMSVELENGITVIDEYAFANCIKLESVSIPATVTSIESYAFYRCSNLADVYYYSTYENWNKIEIDSNNYHLDYPTIHYVNIQTEDYEFINGELIVTGGREVATRFSKLEFAQDIVKITVKGEVEQILEFVFADLPNVTEVNIAKSVSSIGNFAFENCPKLKTVNLDVEFEEEPEEETTEEPVCEISEENTEEYTSAVTGDIGELVLNAEAPDNPTTTTYANEAPDNVTTTTRAYTTTTKPPTTTTVPTTTVAPTTTTQEDTQEYTTIIRDERPTTTKAAYEEPEEDEYPSYRTIGIMAFAGCESLENIVIPETFKTIGNYAFADCTKLNSVTLNDGLKTIGSAAFNSCTSLSEITIPVSTKEMGYDAFYGCTALETVYFNAVNCDITSASDDEKLVFGERDSLKNFYFGEKVHTIPYEILRGNSSITEIVIPDNVKRIRGSAFENCSALTKAVIGSGVEDMGYGVFRDCDTLSDVTIREGVTVIGNYMFSGCGIKSATIPDSVTEIENGAFLDCFNLTNITIPDSVISIEHQAFECCENLTSVTIGKGLERLGCEAFNYCHNLLMVTVDKDNEFFASSDDGVLFSKDGTKLVYYPIGKPNMIYSIPEGIEVIGQCSFVCCMNLVSIGIPVSVETIEDYALSMGDNLTDVYYAGTEEQWNEISKSDWFLPENTTLHFNSTVPDTAVASGTCGDNLTWTLDANGKLTISGTGEMYDYTDISSVPWYSYCSYITTVNIADNVTSISDYAFLSCSNLTNITVDENNNYFSNDEYGVLFNKDKTELIQFPAGNKKIRYTIPNSVITIGEGAFIYCANITSVTIPDSVTTIGAGAFACCTNLIGVTIPDSVTTIGAEAFAGCVNITSVTIPDSVTAIGDFTFFVCEITSITIPESVTTIGRGAFYSCDNLTDVYYIGTEEQWCKIEIDDDNTALTDATIHFGGRTVIDSGTCGDNLTWTLEANGKLTISGTGEMDDFEDGTEPWYSFKSSILQVVVDEGVTTIGDGAFFACISLKSAELGADVKSIGWSAFSYCESLESVTIPESVTGVGRWAFSNCTSLTDVYYSGTETQWNSISFDAWNEALTSATIHFNSENSGTVVDRGNCGDNLTWVLYEDGELVINGTGDMYNYTYLGQTPWAEYNDRIVEITIREGATSVGIGAFYGCNVVKSISIPSTVYNLRLYAFGACTALEAINVSTDNALFCSENGVVYSKDKSTLVRYPAGKTAIGFNIPDSVEVIGNEAFSESVYLESVIIPESVKKIDYHAFYGLQALKTVEIPAGVGIIGNNVFDVCYSLEAINVSADNEIYSSADGVLFNKARTELIYYPAAKETTYTIPDGVKTIKENAFLFSNVDTFVIPTSVTVIETAQCRYGSANKTVYYAGTKAEWNKISIDSSEGLNDALINANVHFDGEKIEYETSNCKISIKRPKVNEVNYGDVLIFEAVTNDLPEGAKVVWSVSGDISTKPIISNDGMNCEVYAKGKGEIKVTATVVNAEGVPYQNVNGNIIKAQKSFAVKAGFREIFIWILKSLFGLTTVYTPEIFL